MSLFGRNALVMGGGRGIGAATALRLGEAGAKVTVAARNESQVVEVAGTLRKRGHEAFAFRCDVADPHDIRNLALSAREAMGGVDILVNSVGTATSNPLGRVTLGEWDHIMAVNATGTFLATQAFFDAMVERGWGRIVNLGPAAGLEGERYVSAYVAAKHAVIGFTKAVAVEAEATGVNVFVVCPGYVDTPLTDETVARIMHATGKSREEALAVLLERAGQPRLIPADAVARAIVGLCEEETSEKNGALVVMDGGSVGTKRSR